MRIEKWKSTPYPKTCAILYQIGIDPSTILIRDLTVGGYRKPILDKQGKRIYDPESKRCVTVEGRWPSLEAAQRVVDSFASEGGYSR